MARSVYWIAVSNDDTYPSIDFSDERNSGQDWLAVGEMLDGIVPVEPSFLARQRIFVYGQVAKIDALWFEHRFLLSAKARACMERAVPGDLSFHRAAVQGGEFFYVLANRVIDCLDIEASDIRFFASDPSRVMAIRKYVLRNERVPDPAAFVLPQTSSRVFCTETVREAVEAAGLIGLRLVDWRHAAPGELVS